jgi:hypothetical protein
MRAAALSEAPHTGQRALPTDGQERSAYLGRFVLPARSIRTMIVAIAAPTATTTGAPIATNAATRGASATETAETRP